MSKMTFKFTHSFDATVIVDVDTARKLIADLRKAADADGFNKLPAKNVAFTHLVIQAADRSEEEGIAELIRFNIRTGLNEAIAADFACVEPELTIRPSPAKVVCHGLEV